MGLPPNYQPGAANPPVPTAPRPAPITAGRRLRAYAQFVAAVFYYFLARSLAHHGAAGLTNELWSPLLEAAMLVFLLLLGYAAMGFMFERQTHPIGEQGFPHRPGFRGEFGLGFATGWGIAVVCAAPMAIVGGVAISLHLHASEWGWLIADAAFFLMATLAEEIAYRGYAFQRFLDAVGPVGAALGFSLYFAIVQMLVPGSSRVSFMVSIILGLLLSTAYLRTRALWVSWGINFGWKAIRALLFGLVVCGVGRHSSVVEGDPMGPYWLTGGGFGLDGTWIAFFAILAAIPVVVHFTRDLDFRYNAPVIVPGGIAVDLDAVGRAQHEAAMGPQAAAEPAPLVQIVPAVAPPAGEQSPVDPPAPPSAS